MKEGQQPFDGRQSARELQLIDDEQTTDDRSNRDSGSAASAPEDGKTNTKSTGSGSAMAPGNVAFDMEQLLMNFAGNAF